MLRLTAVLLLLLTSGAYGDMATVMAEPNLERRSQLAIQQASEEVDAARRAYSDDRMEDFRKLLGEIGGLAELSYKSLQDTGKKARRSPKWFKRAELSLRNVLRRMDGLEKDVSVEDRDAVTEAFKRVQSVHEQILHDIMTKK